MTKKDYIAFADELKTLFSGEYKDEYGEITFTKEQKGAIIYMLSVVFKQDNSLFNYKRFIDYINDTKQKFCKKCDCYVKGTQKNIDNHTHID